MSGWRAFLSSSSPLSFMDGRMAFMEYASLALANMKSSFTSISWLALILSSSAPTIAESSLKMRSISCCSASSSSLSSLFMSTMDCGSMKRVAPEAD